MNQSLYNSEKHSSNDEKTFEEHLTHMYSVRM